MNKYKNRLFDKLEIGVASPKQIRQWAERYLPNGESVGEVTSWETVNYKTLKPEPNGLFCQKIFGPIVDFTCACGKKGTKVQHGFCKKCGVERTLSRVRRYRLGFIKLKQPVVHPLYASHRPSPLSLCLNWSTKRVQAVMKTAEFCNLDENFTLFCSQIESFNSFKPYSNLSAFEKKITNENLNSKNPKQSYPRLFQQKKNKTLFPSGSSISPTSVFTSVVNEETQLYGICYDATWRQVEDFQEFLFYLWEQSFSYEYKIPYYFFTKKLNKNTDQIPEHYQSYSIQTGGLAFQQILSHIDIRSIQLELGTYYSKLQ
ncbi:MAG: hypothetical protein ACKO7P_07805, partial [Bacteroidota bacterium]